MKHTIFLIVCVCLLISGCTEKKQEEKPEPQDLTASAVSSLDSPTCPADVKRNTYPDTPSTFLIPENMKGRAVGVEVTPTEFIVRQWEGGVCWAEKTRYCNLHDTPSVYACLRKAWKSWGWRSKDTSLCPEDVEEIAAYEKALLDDFHAGITPRQEPGPFPPDQLH